MSDNHDNSLKQSILERIKIVQIEDRDAEEKRLHTKVDADHKRIFHLESQRWQLEKDKEYYKRELTQMRRDSGMTGSEGELKSHEKRIESSITRPPTPASDSMSTGSIPQKPLVKHLCSISF